MGCYIFHADIVPYNANRSRWKTFAVFADQPPIVNVFQRKFLSCYKVFLEFKMPDSRQGSGPGLLRYFKP